MKFEKKPETNIPFDAHYFPDVHPDAILDFLSSFGVQAEVSEMWLPGPDRGMTRGVKIRTIFDGNSRTLRSPVPVWVAVYPTGYVDLYDIHTFARKFRQKKEEELGPGQ